MWDSSTKALAKAKEYFTVTLDPSDSLEDSIRRCACGGAPRIRYAAHRVWIRCLSCESESAKSDTFRESEHLWNYMQALALQKSELAV